MLLAIHRAAITTREDNRCISAVRSILRSAALARRQSRFNTRERGVGGLVDGDELATGMGQTERELDLRMAAGQPLVAAVPIYLYLENTFEAVDLGGEIRHRAPVGIDVSDRGRGRAAPRTVINGMAP